jgi:predicted dehydrogenase
MIRLGVIGYGHWGPNLARNFSELDRAVLATVCDTHPERVALAARRHPGIATCTDHRELLADPSIDAVAIATPIGTHYDLCMAALQAGKHVWVEKPLAETVEQALRIADEAARTRRVLLVDHTLVYAGGVRRLGEMVRAGEFGRILTFDATRMNLGLFREVNVIADLGVHDFAILDHVVPERPVAVSATGAAHYPGVPEDVAHVTFFYDSGAIAHVGLSWSSPIRFRQVIVGGDRKMATYNELDASEPLRIFDKGADVSLPADGGRPSVRYRHGDTLVPRVDGQAALRTLSEHFVDCIAGTATAITDALMGARMVEWIDAATRSMHRRGEPVKLSMEGSQ